MVKPTLVNLWSIQQIEDVTYWNDLTIDTAEARPPGGEEKPLHHPDACTGRKQP